jgi:hypothetical protein
MREEPIERRADGHSAPKILSPEKRLYLARPIHRRRDPACRFTAFGFARPVGARAVGSDVKARRARPPDRLKRECRRVRSVEDKE